jgi:hypothetical protein
MGNRVFRTPGGIAGFIGTPLSMRPDQLVLQSGIKVTDDLLPCPLPFRHLIEFPFHVGRVVGTDHIREVVDQNITDLDSQPRRLQIGFVSDDILACQECLDDLGVGRGASDA